MSSKITLMTKHGVILKVTGTGNYQFARDIKLQSLLEGRPLRLSASLPGGGGGVRGTHQSFIRGGSAPRSKPLPYYIPFLVEKIPLSYTFHRKLYPSHIPTERLLLNFSLQKPLKILYLDKSVVGCVCSRYFESPF